MENLLKNYIEIQDGQTLYFGIQPNKKYYIENDYNVIFKNLSFEQAKEFCKLNSVNYSELLLLCDCESDFRVCNYIIDIFRYGREKELLPFTKINYPRLHHVFLKLF